MTVSAWLIGDPGRMPFVGHIRLSASTGEAWLALAARLCPGDVVGGWSAARALAAALGPLESRAETLGAGRFALIRAAWELLAEAPPASLGPDEGSDLGLLMVSGDASGVAVTGVGLSAVWARDPSGAWSPLAGEGHPLLSAPGVPPVPPGVLALEREVDAVVGCPRPFEPELPPPEKVAERCGVRR